MIVTILNIAGCAWLIATSSISDLILNSLALGFVTTVDELIVNSFCPKSLHSNLVNLGFGCKAENEGDEETKKSKKKERNVRSYFKSAGILLFVLCVTYVQIRFQYILPNYGWDVSTRCKQYIHEQEQPLCQATEMS